MKRKMCKSFSAAALAVLLVIMSVFPLSADAMITDSEPTDQVLKTITENLPVSVTSKSVILMDTVTGKVLIAQNEHEKLPPASVTKIMTLLLVMEAIDNGKISLTDTVTVSENASSKGGSQIWLEVGEQMTVDELLKASAVASANDACTALGEFVAGSESAFVNMMNEKAKKLNMKDTNFENCTGLDDTAENHYTTAYDIALMSAELLKYDLIIEYSTIWMDYLRDGKTELVNTNKLIRTYDGITGMKTGTTSKAGYCLSATATRGETSYVAVVLGGVTSADRFKDAKALLDWGFANYEIFTPESDLGKLEEIKVINGVTQSFKPVCEKTVSVLIPKGQAVNIVQKIEVSADVSAPVEKGQSVGKIKFMLGENEICSFNLYSEFEIEKMTFSYAIMRLLYVLTD